MPLPERPRAVVTGAASGLGRAFALSLASRKGRVLIADIDEAGSRETARLVAQAGGEAHTARCDVRKSDEVSALLGEADRALGGVDLLINNAGVASGGLVGNIPLEDWAWVMEINLWGVIYGCHAFVPRFREQGRGAILNVASAAGLLCPPKLSPYNVTKAGVVALSETLHAELAGTGASVTVLCPTFFKTSIIASSRAHGGDAEREAMKKRMEATKIQADEVARIGLSAVDQGRLYALPHQDGRLLWWLKRAAPSAFYGKLLPSLGRFAK
jgi:NAD(P)-dependent dehydrogenase (short-subunit alcohol dehydrogenase family)